MHSNNRSFKRWGIPFVQNLALIGNVWCSFGISDHQNWRAVIMSISFITGDLNKAIILFLVPFEFKVLCQGIFKIHVASEICTLPSHQDFAQREDTWTAGDNLCRKKKLQDLSYALPRSTTDAKKKNSQDCSWKNSLS